MEQRGREFMDLASYIREATEKANPANVVLESTCGCRATEFQVEVDEDADCAMRTCLACGAGAHIGDSDEFWAQVEPVVLRCPCGGTAFEVGVGYSLDDEDEVHWLTVGGRCLACGVMTTAAEWKIDYRPTVHLFEKS